MTGTLLAAETFVLVLLTVLVAGLLRSHAEILKRLHELGAGLEADPIDAGVDGTASSMRMVRNPPRAHDAFAAAVDVDGIGLHEDAMHVVIVGARHHTLLAFLSSGCLTCHNFWEAFADLDALGLPDDLRLVVVAKDAHDDSVSELRRLAPPQVSVVMSSAAWEAYGVPGSPYFVLVDGPEGRVRGEGTGARWDQVWNLLRQASDDSREQIIDRELLANGVEPGHPSLYATSRPLEAASDQ